MYPLPPHCLHKLSSTDLEGAPFFSFSAMQVWPRRMGPTLPEKGFQAGEGNRAETARTRLTLRAQGLDSARRTVTRAPLGSNGMHLRRVEASGGHERQAVHLVKTRPKSVKHQTRE